MVKGFPLNQQEYSYNAQDVSYYYAGRHSGVFALGTNCEVTKQDGMNVKVSKGKGWLAHGVDYGIVFWMEEDVTVTVPTGDSVSPRWDFVCVGWNTLEVKENPQIYIKSGVPSLNPEEPIIENSNDKIEICLAKIYVPAGATNLSDYNVDLIDTRVDKGYCGLVGDDLRTTNLEERAGSLENRAGSLENRAGSLENRVGNLETKTENTNSRVRDIEEGITPAGSATKLDWKRKINGTDFDGSQDINTIKWGGKRRFTIDSIMKEIDGSSNIDFSTINIQEESISYNGSYTDGGVTKKGEKKLLILKNDGGTLYIQQQSIRQLVIYAANEYKVSHKLLDAGTSSLSVPINRATGYHFAFIIGV